MRKSLLLPAFVFVLALTPVPVEATEKASERVSSFAGSFSQVLPIEVPAFRGLEPKLALSYSSEARNGFVGVGWSLAGVSVIERLSPTRGTPLFTWEDKWYLNGQKMFWCSAGITAASCAAGGTHYAEDENYLKVVLDESANTWTVWGKDGTRTVFTPLMTVAPGTVRWGQSQTVDTFGNTVEVGWYCNGECYPNTISYGGYVVQFYREQRPDVIQFPRWDAVEESNHRLRTVVVRQGGANIRAYALAYTTSAATNRSLLASVRQYGTDVVVDSQGAITAGTSLPATALSYQGDATARAFVSPVAPPSSAVIEHLRCDSGKSATGDFDGDGATDTLCVLSNVAKVLTSLDGTPTTWLSGYSLGDLIAGDFDNDGKTDLASYDNWSGNFSVARSTGTAFLAPVFWGTAYGTYGGFAHHCRVDPAWTGVADFNGDALADVYCRKITTGEVFVGRSTGSSFSFSVFAQLQCGNSYDVSVGTMDLDGDRMDDWYCIGENDAFAAFRSTGSSFVFGSFYLSTDWCDSADYRFADVNGDGLTDATCKGNGNVALSNGRAFHHKGSFGGWCTGGQVIAADVDADGAAELVCNRPGTNPDDIQVRQFESKVLQPAQVWRSDGWCPDGVRAWDYNGDGKTDLYCSWGSNPPAAAGPYGVKPDLLVGVTTPLGGSIDVAYRPATEFPNNPDPPGPIYAVTSLTTDDGRGGVATTTFTYRDGKKDRTDGRFLGFGRVKQTLPCLAGEAQCPTRETWYSQDLRSVGSPTRTEFRDGGGRLLRANDLDYTVSPSGTRPRWARLSAETTYEFDGTGTACSSWPCASGKRVRSEHTYDVYGNRTQTVALGDVDAAGDEVTTSVAFAPNTAKYIVGLAGKAETFSGIGTGGTKLAATVVRYDGAATWSTPPTKGAPSHSGAWLDVGDRYVYRTFTHDAWGNVLTDTDPTNRTTTYTYDATQHLFLQTTTDPAGTVQSLAWNTACGTPSQRTDAAGQVTTFAVDLFCRPTQTTLPLGGYELRAYASLGDPTQQRVTVSIPSATAGDGTGDQWSTQYIDGFGRAYKSVAKGPTPGASIVAERGFDARGNLAWATQPRYDGDTDYTTTFSYDSLDRAVAVEHPDGEVVATSYGLRSRTTQDEAGRPTTLRFDAYGRQIQQERSLGGSPVYTDYSYDLLGRMTGMEDAAGNAWVWEFDSLGRMLSKDDPDSGVWTYAYDDAGRQTSQTDAKGQVTAFAYDSVGRLASKTWQSTPPQTTTYAYSQARSGYFNTAMLTEVASPVDVLKLDYDAAGQLARQQRIFESVTYSLERRYDAAGRLTGLTYPDADTVGTPSDPIRYDAAGRLQSIPGFVSNFDWDASGRMIFQVNLNGTVTTRTFNPERGHLTRILTTGPGGTLQDLQYTQDETGRITAVSSPFATESWSYGYDDLGRLVQADNVSDPLESQSFAYDTVGNMTYNSRIGTYVYPSPGQPRPHAPTTINGGSMTYDPNGNLLTGRGRTYTWDWENLPTQINTTQFVYGADRSRLKKLDSGNATLYPLGDDYEIVGGVVTKYVNAVGVGVLGKRVGATPYWSHLDHLGSITLTTDGAGLDNLRRSYRPYGDLLAESGSGIDSRGYIDQREDDETLVTYLHARYYDPQTALFVGPDPLAPFLDGVGPAKYAYALGDPVGGADRSGLIRCGRYSPDGKHCELWILDPVYNDPFTGPRPDGGGGGGSGTGGDGCSRGPNRCTEDGPRGPDRGREPDPRTPTPPGPPSPGRPPSTHPGSTCPPGKQCNSNNSEPACANGDANCDGSIDSAEMAAFVDRTVATTTTNPWITHPCSTGVTWNLYVRSFLDGVGIGLSLVGQFPASVVAPHVATRFSRAGLIGNVGNAAARVNSWDSQILPGPPAGTFSQTCN